MQEQRRHSRLIPGLLSLGLLAGAALTAGPAQAVDAVGPYYAVPSWDQKKAPDTRFVVLTNWGSKAVLDKETGLVWERSPQTQTEQWNNARYFCLALKTVGGRRGWRLPSMPELMSLIDPSVPAPGPVLPPGHPFLMVQLDDTYWTVTSDALDPTMAYSVSFINGLVFGDQKTSASASNHVWCVRGGTNTDAY